MVYLLSLRQLLDFAGQGSGFHLTLDPSDLVSCYHDRRWESLELGLMLH